MPKLSEINPDSNWRGSQGASVPEATANHASYGVGNNTAQSKIKRGPPNPTTQTMTAQQSIDYANEQAMTYISHRITQLNEAIPEVRETGKSVHEWEALLMIIDELEKVRVNIPSYTDPARGMKA
ncbi:MAG: hypothetical protein CMG35_10790 [Candidatus Marinimicrobia bacterium]|mgnify:CR=1 FL=1|jgi:hypothetical protein|nr:hypothetical protein [Candidatus Neomarinimicrobiota bacterium]MBO03113.1 hypothetical protein [Candidatus Neomarinimicrobiota bacterium]|tara:strand:- start:820 stop:1194 length:375 start_codon:yes stop_codon:yes gene_type:complete